jgi:hypothetical protein
VPPYELHQPFQYFAHEGGYIATELGPDVKAVADHPDKENFFELYARRFGRVQRVIQTRLVHSGAGWEGIA